MTPDTITLTPEERRELVAARDMLVRLREAHAHRDPMTIALAGIEGALKMACPHNPEFHELRDCRFGWEVTCPACAATWTQFDDIRLFDRREPR